MYIIYKGYKKNQECRQTIKHTKNFKLIKNFSVLIKSTHKFDCLIYEMFFYSELRPTLNVQSVYIRAEIFS